VSGTYGAPWGAKLKLAIALAYTAVTIDADGEAVTLDDASSPTFGGILQRAGDAGSRQAVITSGRTKAIAGAKLTRGTHSLLQVGTDGKLEPLAAGGVPVARWLPRHPDYDANPGAVIEVALLDGAQPPALAGTATITAATDSAAVVLNTAAFDGAAVVVTAASLDATATHFSAQVAAGTLTITANANATADLDIHYRIGA